MKHESEECVLKEYAQKQNTLKQINKTNDRIS